MAYDSAGNAVSNGIRPGDWLFSESNYIYTRESGYLKNATSQAGTNPDVELSSSQLIGMPVRKVSDRLFRFATAAEVAAAAPAGDQIWGFVIEGVATGALDNDVVTGTEYAILMRGPAIVNDDLMPVNDPYGAAFDAAEYKILLRALNINSLPSPATTSIMLNQ